MAGPDPAVAQIRSAVRPALVASDQPVLVACSGGADSLALAAAVAFEAPRAGVPGGGGDRRPRAAGRLGRRGRKPPRPCCATSASTRSPSSGCEVGRDGGPEAAARTARYAALRTAAGEHGARIALGHTLDDQAETVLLGLGRGSGPRSVAGMVAGQPAVLAPAARHPAGDHPCRLRRARAAGLGRPVEHRPRLHPGAAAHRGAAPARGRARRRGRPRAGPHRRAAARGPRPARRARPRRARPAGRRRRRCPRRRRGRLPAALRRRVLRDWLRDGGVPDLQARPPRRGRRAAHRAGAGRAGSTYRAARASSGRLAGWSCCPRRPGEPLPQNHEEPDP